MITGKMAAGGESVPERSEQQILADHMARTSIRSLESCVGKEHFKVAGETEPTGAAVKLFTTLVLPMTRRNRRSRKSVIDPKDLGLVVVSRETAGMPSIPPEVSFVSPNQYKYFHEANLHASVHDGERLTPDDLVIQLGSLAESSARHMPQLEEVFGMTSGRIAMLGRITSRLVDQIED